MKHTFFAFLALVSFVLFVTGAQAASDSVAVFHRSEKVVILLTETRPGRLHQMMDAFGFGANMLLISEDQSVKIDCGRNAEASTCTIRLLPSATVQLGAKSVKAQTTLSDIQASVENNFEMRFTSSREDFLVLRIVGSDISIQAGKRGTFPAANK